MIAVQIKQAAPKITLNQLLAMGEPIGNYETQGGRLDTRRHGPAIALAGAIGSISAGAGIIAGAGLFSAAGLVGGLMVAGGVLTAVGAVSGNDKLLKIGGALSLVGGVGSAFVSGGRGSQFLLGKEGGYNFSDSILGEKVKGFFGDAGLEEMSSQTKAVSGEDIINAAKANESISLSSVDPGAASMTDQLTGAADPIKAVTNSGEAVKTIVKGGDAVKDTSSWKDILKSKEGLASLSGVSDAVVNFTGNRARQPLVDSQTNYYDAQTDIALQNQQILEEQRANRSYIPTAERGRLTDPNAVATAQARRAEAATGRDAQGQVLARGGDRVAFVENGQIRYVTREELEQIQAQNPNAANGLVYRA